MKLADEIKLTAGGPGSGRKPTGMAQMVKDKGFTKELKTKVPGFAAYQHPQTGHTIHISPTGTWSRTDADNKRTHRGDDDEDLYRHFNPSFQKGDLLPGKYW